MSAREWRAVREGETHAATKTSKNNTQESFIVGVGASGALLAGAAIVFVTLVGLVSFNVWPAARSALVDGNVELSAPTPGTASHGTTTTVAAAAGQLASTGAATGAGGSGGGGGGGGNHQGGGNDSHPKSGVQTPPATAPTAPSTDGSTGDSGSGTSSPGTASKDPSHLVHPAHPDTPHQNVSTGTKEKEDGSTSAVVNGKGPFAKPTVPSSSDTGTSLGPGRGHGSSKSKH